jgi:hypothetical protein
MTELGVRWSAEHVLALAPDDASRRAGTRLGTAGPWPEAGSSGAAVWGLCRGSGSKPYRTVVDTEGPAYKCTCPSRKFPCKHALGLLLLWAADEEPVAGTGEPPGWAAEWLASRRRSGERREERIGAGAPKAKAADPVAALRRAERRAARITSGVTELEQRLADLLRGGLAAAEQQGHGPWEETAARMIDAQAPGLAARVRELGAIPASGAGWPARLLEESALLHLLDRGWSHRDELPEPLARTVLTRVGLPSPPGEAPVRDRWSVLAQYDTSDGRLTTRRIWLYGTGAARWALLVAFGAAGAAPEPALPAGRVVEAAITPHTGAGQLRAGWGEQFGVPGPMSTPPPGGSVTDAVEAYGAALSEDPWLDCWPVTLRQVVPVTGTEGSSRGGTDGWQLVDADGGAALPVARAAVTRPGLWKLASLAGGGPVTVFGECGHRGFDPLAAWSQEIPGMVPLI